MNKLIKQILTSIKYFPMRLKYRIQGYKIGKNFVVGKEVNIEKIGFKSGNNVYIGQYSYIGPKTQIGNYCMLSDYVNIIGHDHKFEKLGTPIILSGRPYDEPKTLIEDDVWIGHGVTIMRGVKIGEGSIIGANSVVTKDIPAYSIYVGVPARFVRMRFKSEEERIFHSKKLKEYNA